MARLKIDYGIDLGTTNSAICRMEKGEPIIKKTDTLKDTLPSCVSITTRKRIKVGDGAYNDMKSDKRRATKTWKSGSSNTYIEFKRSMGTDKHFLSTNMERSYNSEELSAEVLKTLKSFITDENFNSVVITVPAKFTVNQKTATMAAAKLAGFNYCELLQEPIAASMAYGLSTQAKNGYWMVFDFGGGTFDAALLKVEDGIMQVFDTAGDNYLGGKNLDEAIVDNIIIPYVQNNYSIESILSDANKKEVLREAMKTYAEELKNQLSFKEKEDIISNLGELGEDENGEEIELDLTVTQAEAFDTIRPLFQKSVNICKELLLRNNMSGESLDKLILVGGPTHSPLIRQMLMEQITPNVDTSIDPMTAVATGAALYASTLNCENKNIENSQSDTISLEIGYEATSVELSEWVSVRLEESKQNLKNIWIELVRGDKAWSSGKLSIDEKGDVIEVNLLEGKSNMFSIFAYDDKGSLLPCFPNEIVIIQGTKIGSATLPYNIGIATWDNQKEKAVFSVLQGLEKNKPLPAVGVKNGLKTTDILRPGIGSDTLRIPVYQAEDDSEGRSASIYEYVADVVITGKDITSQIPEGSNVDITLKADNSEMMSMEVFFPSLDLTISKELDTTKKQSLAEAESFIYREVRNAENRLFDMENMGFDVSTLQEDLETVKTENQNSSEKKAVLQHLKEVLRKLEQLEYSTEWERLEKDLKSEYERLKNANAKLGNDKSTQIVEQLYTQMNQVIQNKNVELGREVFEQLHQLFIHLTMLYQCIAVIKDLNERFDFIQWIDRNRARQLINKAIQIINSHPTVEKLQPATIDIIELLPQAERGNTGGLLGKR
ncbi:Hsp70 family protein [uncultured Parabacteroides sp.]|uniref:Hsp70 family protein n=1 Tax=uncultured Parabacteroides sp. TaxID=512312 RepID=UPI0028047C67|nr:Hsp70 family protein [uncultured Parabacteroides sp.]